MIEAYFNQIASIPNIVQNKVFTQFFEFEQNCLLKERNSIKLENRELITLMSPLKENKNEEDDDVNSEKSLKQFTETVKAKKNSVKEDLKSLNSSKKSAESETKTNKLIKIVQKDKKLK